MTRIKVGSQYYQNEYKFNVFKCEPGQWSWAGR